jgi:hypothetical protein
MLTFSSVKGIFFLASLINKKYAERGLLGGA